MRTTEGSDARSEHERAALPQVVILARSEIGLLAARASAGARARRVPVSRHGDGLGALSRQELGSLIGNAPTAELVSLLAHEQPHVREYAAAYLGDRLVHACKTGADTDEFVLPLVEALQRESDPVVQEEVAHSLGFLVEYGAVPPGIVPALQECSPRLDAEAVEHVDAIIEAAAWPRGRHA